MASLLSFWGEQLNATQSTVRWEKTKHQPLLHLTMACFASEKVDLTNKDLLKQPVFLHATFDQENQKSEQKVTLCVLRWNKTDNQSLELFFDTSVTFSISGGNFPVQLTGQTAAVGTAVISSAEGTQQTTTTRADRNIVLSDDGADSSEDEDYHPQESSDSSDSSDSSEVEDNGKRKAASTLLSQSSSTSSSSSSSSNLTHKKKKQKKSTNNSDSSDSSDSSNNSDNDSDSDSVIGSGNGTNHKTQDPLNTMEKYKQKLYNVLKNMQASRVGVKVSDLGTKFQEEEKINFKEATGQKLTKFIKENSETFTYVETDQLVQLK